MFIFVFLNIKALNGICELVRFFLVKKLTDNSLWNEKQWGLRRICIFCNREKL